MGLQGAINSWVKQYGCSLGNPVEANILNEAVSELGLFPIELLELYQYCNGLTFRWFKVLPIEDKQNTKQNWDGLRRTNDPRKTEYLGKNQELLQRFLIFADLSARTCAAIDRVDGSIWYEEDGELHQTDFSILEFIDTCSKEAKEIP